MLLLFPATFKIGWCDDYTLTDYHHLLIVIKGRKGGFEFIMLQIPIFIVWGGYPITEIQRFIIMNILD